MFLTVKNSLKTCLIVSGPLWNFLNICNTHLTLFYCILPLVTFLIHPKILKSQKKFIVFKKMTDISHKIVIDWVCRYDRGIFTEPNIGFYYETMRFNLCFHGRNFSDIFAYKVFDVHNNASAQMISMSPPYKMNVYSCPKNRTIFNILYRWETEF